MDAEFRCTLPTFNKFRTKDDDIVTQSLEEQVSVSEIGYSLVTQWHHCMPLHILYV